MSQSEWFVQHLIMQELLMENEELRRQNDLLRQEEENLRRDVQTMKSDVSQQKQDLQQKLKDLEVHKQTLQTHVTQRLRNANHKILQLRTLVEDLQEQLYEANSTILQYKNALRKALADCEESQRMLYNLESHLRHVQPLRSRSPPGGVKNSAREKITNLELRIGDIENKLTHLTLPIRKDEKTASDELDSNILPDEDVPCPQASHRKSSSPLQSHSEVVKPDKMVDAEEGASEDRRFEFVVGALSSSSTETCINISGTLDDPDFPDTELVFESAIKRHNSCDPIDEGRVGSPRSRAVKCTAQLTNMLRSNSTSHLDDIKSKKKHRLSRTRNQRPRAATALEEAVCSEGTPPASVKEIRERWLELEKQTSKPKSWKFWKK